MSNIKFYKIIYCWVNISLVCVTWFCVVNGEKEPQEQDNAAAVSSPDTAVTQPTVKTTENVGFIHAFVASISVILVSEIGDKTFFIAAIMAMRHPRLTVFAGAMSALALMTVLSALFGWLINVIPRAYTYYISTALFAVFGIKMLKEGFNMTDADAQGEIEEVQSDLRRKDEEFEKETVVTDPENGGKRTKSPGILSLISRVFLQAFTLTFLAEWGDRSQLTTIILGANQDVYGVIIGGVLGHSLCTGLAVLGGRMIAQKISVKTVTIIGGVVFLLFAFSALFFDPNAE